MPVITIFLKIFISRKIPACTSNAAQTNKDGIPTTSVEPLELKIYRHPKTQKHLGCAMIDFPSYEDSKVLFIFSNTGMIQLQLFRRLSIATMARQ